MKIKTPWIENADLCKIFELLDYNARFVGGCVRDLILFDQLVYDIDIATPLLPEVVMQKLSNQFKVVPTGLEHGTVSIFGKHKYEITTLRKDAQTDGRHAQVIFDESWEEDSKRRDFTMNALYSDFDGNVYDYHNGLVDLKNNNVKFIGNPDERICEDFLRILRFFRFSMRFGSMNKDGLKACLVHAKSLLGISRERIAQEWFKIIEGKFFWQYLNDFASVLDKLSFNSDIKKIDGLTNLGISSMFINENSYIQLSNNEKKYIKNINTLKLNNIYDAIKLKRKFGVKFIADLMILRDMNFDIPDLGEFPIKGQDLMQLGYKGAEIGIKMEELYLIWIKSFGKFSKQDLLEGN